MAALPYMPLFVADYLADTAHLTATQHGAYMLLLMNYWQRGGPLPDDDRRLASIARLGLREWRRNRIILEEFFTVTHGAWVHTRVDTELARVEAKSLKSKKAAQASVERRFGGRSADVEPTDTDKRIVPLPNGNGAEADPDKAFWDSAKAYLGKSKASLIGKWVGQYGREVTASAIAAAQVERAVDPIAFIEGRFRKQKQDQAAPAWDGMP